MSKHDDDLELLTRDDVLDRLKIGRTTLYELVRKGKIQRVKGTRKLLFSRRALAKFIEGEGSHA